MAQHASKRTPLLRYIFNAIERFSRYILQRPLRAYQLAPARAIIRSVICGLGQTFAVVMSRQAGKNELSAQLEAYLLTLLSPRGGTIVKAAPTYTPQAAVSLDRLAATLDNPLSSQLATRQQGHTVSVGKASAVFLSAQLEANVVGHTASILLECDEAQDVDPGKWDKDFAPMAAASNATTVFYGTPWTRNTLLARVVRELRAQEARDGVQRVFFTPAPAVSDEVPAYAKHLDKQISRLGRTHPLIRTQYFLEELDAGSGMFPPERRALMQGQHLPLETPVPGCAYAFLLDFAGPALPPSSRLESPDAGPAASTATGEPSREDPRPPAPTTRSEDLSRLQRAARTRQRDATVLTIVAIDTDDTLALPVYRVVHRRAWVGTDHRTLYGQLIALAEAWDPVAIIADATGVGAGLTDLLRTALGDRVIPVVFTSARKSDIGWRFIAACDAGRFRDHARTSEAAGTSESETFWHQVEAAEIEYLPGPGQRIRWGVSDPTIHDDLLVSAALCVVLDDLNWGTGGSIMIPP